MSSHAEHVFTDPCSIQHLEMLIEHLPTNGHVLLNLKGGEAVDAIVSVRPSIQTFIDPAHHEGMNGQVRLERPDRPQWWRTVWLDEIASVQHLDSSLASET